MNLDIKYRPNTWENVVGQGKAVKSLQEQARFGTISNAYLFTGPSGVGKTTLAMLFAKAANCTDVNNGNPCNKCGACLNFKFWFKHINGADTRGIAEMRKIMEEMHYKNPYAKYKFIFIDEIASVTKQAFESILTSVENPPKNVVWLFASVEQNRIPKTIQTRCQTFKLNSLSWTDIRTGIIRIINIEKIDISDTNSWKIAKMSGNSMRQAIKVLEKGAEAIEINEADDYLDGLLNIDTQLWPVFKGWKKKYDSYEDFLNAIKRQLVTLIKVNLKLEKATPYVVRKFEKYNKLSPNFLYINLKLVVDLLEKISGVYDYETLSFMLFLNTKGL